MNALTQAGQSAALQALANKGTNLRLFLNTSVPNKDPGIAVWHEVPTANGYAAIPISSGSWTLTVDTDGNMKLTLNTYVVSATGPINGVEGAYITDALGNVIVWWDRGTPANLVAADTCTLIGLYIKLT